MPWKGSILAKRVWYLGIFLYLNGQNFLEIWEVFCYYFIEYITFLFDLHLFSFFNAYDSQIWYFNGVADFFSQLLSYFTKSSSLFFPLTSILVSGCEILFSPCSSLLEWPTTVLLFEGTFCFQDFCLILFSEVFHIFVQLLFHILCCLL
jgi:hypothetical protein